MEKTDNTSNINQPTNNISRHRLIGLIVVVILLFFSFMFGAFVGRVSPRMQFHRFNSKRGMGYSYQQLVVNSPQSVNSITIQGVITSVNGNSLTVAGDGLTNNITTNSSTQYVNGNSPKVNDTVSISAQFNNNQLTAQSININP